MLGTSAVAAVMLVVGLASSLPLDPDSQLVESTVREVRADSEVRDLLASATGGHYGSQGGGGHGDVGYLRTKDSKGDDGYQKFDSFHKKDGDSYGFETHSAFGKADGGESGGKHHHSGSYQQGDGGSHGDDYAGAGTGEIAHYEHAGGGGDGGHHFSSGYEGGDGGHHFSGGDGGHHSAHYTSGGNDGHHGGGGSEGHYSDGGASHEHYSSGGGDGGYHEYH